MDDDHHTNAANGLWRSPESMVPTWFRTLTLAHLRTALPDSPLGRVPWQFCNCPRIQFWIDDATPS